MNQEDHQPVTMDCKGDNAPLVAQDEGVKAKEDLVQTEVTVSLNQNGTPLSPITNPDDLALLAKLEEANRAYERDKKSVNPMRSLSIHSNTSKPSSVSGHSRRGSASSMYSVNSQTSNQSNLHYEDETGNPNDLWELWGKIIIEWDSIFTRKSYIRDLVRKGIPHHFRGIVWQMLVNAQNSPYKEQYAEFLKQTSPCEKVIRRDITRTYPDHDFFKEKNGLGQESLFNVMKAYSLFDREVGYCQGSGFIVGLLLMQMPEEEAFAVLVKLMQDYRLRELFKPSMAELGLCMFQLECMIQDQLPDLYMHFQAQSFCVSMFASSWFLTLFTTALPNFIACRVFDVFLSEGMEMIFKIGFAILSTFQSDLLSQDMEGMLRFLQKEMPARLENDPNLLLNCAYLVKYSPRKMKKLEKEYNALKTKEQEEQVELRRLRTENRLLRQRIDNLETETATLADRLIQGQVVRAEQEEECFSLKRDLSTLKTKSAEALQRENGGPQSPENSVGSASSVEIQHEEDLEKLKDELAEVKKREHEATCTIKELHSKMRELESANRQLQTEPCTEIQQLQEELIATKLREAEATLSMKELRQKVYDLDKLWQKHKEKLNQSPTSSDKKLEKKRSDQLSEELMTVRLREAESMAELKDMKQKVMELETQNQICNRHIKRLDDENNRLKETVEGKEILEKELRHTIRDNERKVSDMDSKKKEENMMGRIKDAEHSQKCAEMRQRIAELEIENQELVTAGQLRERGDNQEMENRITDLQEEVMQLKMARRLQSISSMALSHMNLDTESDYDSEDMDNTLSDSKLKSKINSIEAQRLKLADFDSSEGEGFVDHETGTVKRRTSKKKRKIPSHPRVGDLVENGGGRPAGKGGNNSSAQSDADNENSAASDTNETDIGKSSGQGKVQEILKGSSGVNDAEEILDSANTNEEGIIDTQTSDTINPQCAIDESQLNGATETKAD